MIRVATFNVLFGHRATGPGSWPERLPLLRRAIGAARADVLGLQEVLPSKLADVQALVAPLTFVAGPPCGAPRFDFSSSVEWLARSLRTRRLAMAHEVRAQARTERMLAGEHQPIAYREDRFERLDSGGFWISPHPERPGTMLPRAHSPFLVHWARLAARDGSGPLIVLNVHFGHAPWHHAATAAIVTERIRALEAGTAERPSLFLVGDFNALRSSRLVRALTSAPGPGLVDAARSSPTRTGPPATFHWGVGARRLGLTLDYVLARTPLRPARAEVVDVHEGPVYPSDHHPLVVEFIAPAV